MSRTSKWWKIIERRKGMPRYVAEGAKWWADQLRNGVRHYNGDPVQTAMMNMLTRNRAPIAESRVKRFEVALAARMRDAVEDCHYQAIVSTDYDPDPALREALMEAGIVNDFMVLPVKTVMWLEISGTVKVACGYGAKPEVVFCDPNPGDLEVIKDYGKE